MLANITESTVTSQLNVLNKVYISLSKLHVVTVTIQYINTCSIHVAITHQTNKIQKNTCDFFKYVHVCLTISVLNRNETCIRYDFFEKSLVINCVTYVTQSKILRFYLNRICNLAPVQYLTPCRQRKIKNKTFNI